MFSDQNHRLHGKDSSGVTAEYIQAVRMKIMQGLATENFKKGDRKESGIGTLGSHDI